MLPLKRYLLSHTQWKEIWEELMLSHAQGILVLADWIDKVRSKRKKKRSAASF